MLLWKQNSRLSEEMLPELFAWNVGGKFLDKRAGGGERLPGFCLSCLALIELAKSYANTPQERLCALHTGNFLRSLQGYLSFCDTPKRS